MDQLRADACVRSEQTFDVRYGSGLLARLRRIQRIEQQARKGSSAGSGNRRSDRFRYARRFHAFGFGQVQVCTGAIGITGRDCDAVAGLVWRAKRERETSKRNSIRASSIVRLLRRKVLLSFAFSFDARSSQSIRHRSVHGVQDETKRRGAREGTRRGKSAPEAPRGRASLLLSFGRALARRRSSFRLSDALGPSVTRATLGALHRRLRRFARDTASSRRLSTSVAGSERFLSFLLARDPERKEANALAKPDRRGAWNRSALRNVLRASFPRRPVWKQAPCGGTKL